MKRGVNLGLPRLRPEDAARRDAGARARDAQAQTAERLRRDERLLVRPRGAGRRLRTSFADKARYLLSPWTFASSLDLMRRSRTLAFTGWEKRARRRRLRRRPRQALPRLARGRHARGRKARRPPRRAAAELRVEPAHVPRRGARDRPRANGWRVVGSRAAADAALGDLRARAQGALRETRLPVAHS